MGLLEHHLGMTDLVCKLWTQSLQWKLVSFWLVYDAVCVKNFVDFWNCKCRSPYLAVTLLLAGRDQLIRKTPTLFNKICVVKIASLGQISNIQQFLAIDHLAKLHVICRWHKCGCLIANLCKSWFILIISMKLMKYPACKPKWTPYGLYLYKLPIWDPDGAHIPYSVRERPIGYGTRRSCFLNKIVCYFFFFFIFVFWA